MPRRLSSKGGCTAAPVFRFRNRNWRSTAAAPMAATITIAIGLKKARRLVNVTIKASAPHNNPDAITVLRRAEGTLFGGESLVEVGIGRCV
jgi:hypothetical protein